VNKSAAPCLPHRLNTRKTTVKKPLKSIKNQVFKLIGLLKNNLHLLIIAYKRKPFKT